MTVGHPAERSLPGEFTAFNDSADVILKDQKTARLLFIL